MEDLKAKVEQAKENLFGKKEEAGKTAPGIPSPEPKKFSKEKKEPTGDPLEDEFNNFKEAREEYEKAKLEVEENQDDPGLIQGFRDARANALSRFITIKDTLVKVLEAETKR